LRLGDRLGVVGGVQAVLIRGIVGVVLMVVSRIMVGDLDAASLGGRQRHGESRRQRRRLGSADRGTVEAHSTGKRCARAGRGREGQVSTVKVGLAEEF
jgi:hypothetical protein